LFAFQDFHHVKRIEPSVPQEPPPIVIERLNFGIRATHASECHYRMVAVFAAFVKVALDYRHKRLPLYAPQKTKGLTSTHHCATLVSRGHSGESPQTFGQE
jgi:hypothetical protein